MWAIVYFVKTKNNATQHNTTQYSQIEQQRTYSKFTKHTTTSTGTDIIPERTILSHYKYIIVRIIAFISCYSYFNNIFNFSNSIILSSVRSRFSLFVAFLQRSPWSVRGLFPLFSSLTNHHGHQNTNVRYSQLRSYAYFVDDCCSIRFIFDSCSCIYL